MKDQILKLNKILKRSRKLDLLNFIVSVRKNGEVIEYQARLNIDQKIFSSSGWYLREDDAKNQCARNMLHQIKHQPNFDLNEPVENQPIFKIKTLFLFSVFLNIVSLIIFFPVAMYILFPILLCGILLLTVPFFLNKGCNVLQCKEDRVVVRPSISYDEYILPIKYLSHTDYMIDRSNGAIPQHNDNSTFLAFATKDIFLDFVNIYEDRNEDPHYKIVKGCNFRVNVKNKKFTATVRIIKKDGKVLTYQSLDIGDNENDSVFCKKNFSLIKVHSKHGTHYMAKKFSKTLELSFAKKYKIITLIYYYWLISFFQYYINLFLKK